MSPPPVQRREAGSEPIPGYRLLEPLGQGGFGEVWKCEAPGGLYKAIKFVGGADALSATCQERAALERVKSLRHPFILSLERVEDLGDSLVVVMELADTSLQELYRRYRKQGQSGIPRDELLGYLEETAEALDWMNFQHGLQHLDVKPHNLFLICNHVKVADFGLVYPVGGNLGEQSEMRRGGLTPLYGAPEMLRGTLSPHSDQYSLAVVYQQLLTGTLPFWHNSAYELMMLHLTESPDLAALSETDRVVVARALAKVPEQRFPSCQEFIQALQDGRTKAKRRTGAWRKYVAGEPSAPATTEAAISLEQDEPRGSRSPQVPTPIPPTTRTDEAATIEIRDAAKAEDENATASAANAEPIVAKLSQTTPTAVMLPGYRFLTCLNQSPLGDLWIAENAVGQRRRATCLLGFVRYDARLIRHLQTLRDLALLPTEVHWSPAERLVILTEWFEGTLRDRFDRRLTEGYPGIPRNELLALLRTAAEALDGLNVRHGLQHLGIHPRNLLVQGSRLWLADFGLIPLVWIPTGQSPASLNGRYAAPELFDRLPSGTADQYSLALIYAEMLTGIHPRSQRGGSGHRGLSAEEGSTRAGSAHREVKLDLDLLPVYDREIVLKALSPEPEKRFSNCLEFLEALEQAGKPRIDRVNRYHELLSVIPLDVLLGKDEPTETIVPPIGQIVLELTQLPGTSRESTTIEGPRNARYLVQPDGSWECCCPFQLLPGAMPIKIEGFRDHWNAQIVEQTEERYRLLVDLPIPRSFWERVIKQPKRIEVEVTVPGGPPQLRVTEARIRLNYRDTKDQQRRILSTMAPRLFESMREYLQASVEQRGKLRRPLFEEIHVYPIEPNLRLGETLIGETKDVSFEGIRLVVPKEPPTEYFYLHLCKKAEAREYAILAQKIRKRNLDVGCEIGARFPQSIENASPPGASCNSGHVNYNRSIESSP